MTPPVPGLRRLWLNAVSPAKVSLSVQPGEVLEVSEDLAAQLIAADPHFKDAAPVELKVSVSGVVPAEAGAEVAEAIAEAAKPKGKKG